MSQIQLYDSGLLWVWLTLGKNIRHRFSTQGAYWDQGAKMSLATEDEMTQANGTCYDSQPAPTRARQRVPIARPDCRNRHWSNSIADNRGTRSHGAIKCGRDEGGSRSVRESSAPEAQRAWMQNRERARAMAALASTGVPSHRSVATSAVREASNRQEFLALVREETGLKIRVINGEDEARLSYRSALAHFDLASGRSVIMDIGGGSLELVLSADGLVDRFISLPFGAIRLTEEFLTETNGLKGVRRSQTRSPELGRSYPLVNGGQRSLLRRNIHEHREQHIARQGMTPHGRFTDGSREWISTHRRYASQHVATERGLVPDSQGAGGPLSTGLRAAEVLARLEARGRGPESEFAGHSSRAARVTPPCRAGEARERSVKDLAERSHSRQRMRSMFEDRPSDFGPSARPRLSASERQCSRRRPLQT